MITREDPLPGFDVHYPLLSLPLLFHTTPGSIPAEMPYLEPDAIIVQKWEDRIQPDTSRLKVGLVWSSNPKNTGIHSKKSVPLHTFSPLAGFHDVTFYSLQKGEAAAEAKSPPGGMRIVDYTDEILDFSDTAAFMENLDLVISVDTAVAHLAGALGKPVWTLLPYDPDWRWMLNRGDSPWYPTMRLFRKSSPGDGFLL